MAASWPDLGVPIVGVVWLVAMATPECGEGNNHSDNVTGTGTVFESIRVAASNVKL